MCFVIVGECTVKWILPRCEFYGQTTAPISRIRIIKTAIAFCPLFVPCTCAIRDEIIATRLLANPKNSCYDLCFPRIWPRTPRRGRCSDEGFIFVGDRFDLSEGRIDGDKQSQATKAK
jgi:hypothetical protein